MAGDRDNSVVITGNLSRDPELRFGNSGNPILNLSIAVNKSKKGPDGTWENEGMFFDVKAFGDLAENAASSLTKGNRVTVTGKLDVEKWTDKETGGNRTKIVILADDISASFKWATGTIQRTERREGGNFGGGSRNAGGSYGGGSAQNNDFDEEPF